jgi:ATP-binding cassette subfamily C protein
MVIVLSAVSSLFEGLSITMLFPLLALSGIDGDGGISSIASYIDHVLSYLNINISIYSSAIIFVTFVIIQHTFFLLQSWQSAGLQVMFVAYWRQKLIDAYLKSNWNYFSEKNSGHLSHVMIVEPDRASNLISYLTNIIMTSFTAVAYLVVAFITSWQISLLLIACGIVIVTITCFIVRNPRKIAEEQARVSRNFTSNAQEMISGMKLIRASEGAEQIKLVLTTMISRIQASNRLLAMHPAFVRSTFEVAAVASLAATLVVGIVYLEQSGAVVLLIVAMFIRLYPRISSIQQFMHSFRLYMPFYEEVVGTLDEVANNAEPEARGGKYRISQGHSPDIVVNEASVAYGRMPALRNVSFRIPARHTVAIVGPSGAGKSTLVDAILGLVPLQSGTIEIDGVPLEEINVASWRRAVGYVAQDTFLFNATIRDNIAFAKPGADDLQICAAAEKAQLCDFINSLPDGYDSIVGDRGVKLSGGQRQRIGLARALLGDPAVLILDEPTSSLDSHTEAAIIHDIEKLRGKTTIIVIAHRLSSLRQADLIHVLDQGRLVESGTWTELIKMAGHFSRLWQIQSATPEGTPLQQVVGRAPISTVEQGRP